MGRRIVWCTKKHHLTSTCSLHNSSTQLGYIQASLPWLHYHIPYCSYNSMATRSAQYVIVTAINPCHQYCATIYYHLPSSHLQVTTAISVFTRYGKGKFTGLPKFSEDMAQPPGSDRGKHSPNHRQSSPHVDFQTQGKSRLTKIRRL